MTTLIYILIVIFYLLLGLIQAMNTRKSAQKFTRRRARMALYIMYTVAWPLFILFGLSAMCLVLLEKD